MLETRKVQTLGWHSTVSDTVFGLSPGVVNQCLGLIEQANAAFVPEETAIYRRTGEPTAIGRLDFTIVGDSGEQLALPANHNGHFPVLDGTVRPYEWEERPGGIGLSRLMSPAYAEALDELTRHWPAVRVTVAGDRKGHDDGLWRPEELVTEGPDVPDDGTLVIVRAEPEQREFHSLVPRSFSTVTAKGDKTYGAAIGWWQLVSKTDQIPAPGTDTVVLKPLQGSKARGLLFCPPRNADGQPGMVTRTRLVRQFEERVGLEGGMYLQPWYPPIAAHDANLILRIFFGRGLTGRSAWTCLGGCWNLRKNVLVHGAKDTVFGPAQPV